MQTIYLDISNKGIIPTINAKQNDVGRKFVIKLTNNGASYIIPDGVAFSAWYSGVSGEGNYTHIGDRSAFAINGNTVTVEIIAQMLINAGGGVLCLIMNSADGSQLGLWNIAYMVEEIQGADSEAAQQYYTAFSEAAAAFATDPSLSMSGKAADAKTTGDAIAAERARIDNLATLEEGSTTGDAELQDIRVGYDGKQYANAGEAVRGQVGQLSSEIIAGKKLSLAAKENGYHNNYNCLELWESGAIDSNGPVANNTRMRIKTYLDKNITVIDIDENYSFMVYRYNNDVVDTSYYTGWIKTITLDQAQYDYKVFVKKDDNTGIGDNIISHYSAVNLLGLPIYEKKEFVIDKSGNGDFTSLVKGLRKAYAYKDATFYVNSGVYDLIQEFKEEYGDDFFTNFTTESIRGIVLLNHCKVIFSPNATVNCNYDGDNEIVMQYFAPFNSGEGGFEIYGLQLYASRVRYCFHDELGSNTVPYVSKYRNCYMKLDNTGNTAWSADQCIGGGLGKSALIDISGCIFESVRVGNDLSAVSYHNSAVTNAKSQIIIEGNYISGNKTIRLSWYGDSTSITNAIVSNNNVGSEIIYRAESTEAANRNISLLAWNNVVRNTGT